MLGTQKITLGADGFAGVMGLDLGPDVTVHHQTASILVLKAGGHSTWASLGQQAYVPTRFYVYAIEEYISENEAIAELITDFPVRSQVV